MKIYSDISSAIGNTPLIRAKNFEMAAGISGVEILAKLECQNPTGSAKDRAALYMINDAEERGLISEGATVIEPTSGNTGIAIAQIAAARGYKAIIVMPDTMSEERRKMISAYGAKIVLTDGKGGMAASIEEAEKIQKTTKNAVILGQFTNPANARAHYETTGPEIYEATGGDIDAFIAGIGTGGTISGVGKFLKEKKPEIEVIGVEPESSPLITRGFSGAHGIQGIGANFIPEIYDPTLVDRVVTASDGEAFSAARLFAESEGVLVGISAGAALAAAVRIAKDADFKGRRIAVLIPDSGNRYFSTKMYNS